MIFEKKIQDKNIKDGKDLNLIFISSNCIKL